MSNFEEILEALRFLPNPEASWLAVQSELLLSDEAMRNMGAVDIIGGAVLQTVPEKMRNDLMPQVLQVSQASWNMFEETYKGSADLFNNDRNRLYESIRGILSSPKSA